MFDQTFNAAERRRPLPQFDFGGRGDCSALPARDTDRQHGPNPLVIVDLKLLFGRKSSLLSLDGKLVHTLPVGGQEVEVVPRDIEPRQALRRAETDHRPVHVAESEGLLRFRCRGEGRVGPRLPGDAASCDAVEMAVVLSSERLMLYPGDFPLPAGPERISLSDHFSPDVPIPDDGLDFDRIERRVGNI